MNWIIGLLVVGLIVAVMAAMLFRRMFHVVLLAEPKPARSVIAVAKFELMEEEEARKILAGRNERDPLVCALLTLLHEAKADAALESNLATNPEWLAQRCAGGLHWLLQFEADLKEALSAAAEPPPEKTET